MSAQSSLLSVGEATADAVEQLLKTLDPEAKRAGAVTASQNADEAVMRATSGMVFPAVAADVGYVDGVTGGNVFLLPLDGARKLASSMMGGAPSDSSGDELSELELSAVGEAMNQMMSAAAAATGSALGQEIQIAPPEIVIVRSEDEAAALLQTSGAQHVLVTGYAVGEGPSRLVQMVPNAFVVRMERALEAKTTEYTSAPMGDALRAVPVRVWAELGRARMPAGSSLALPTGSVVELDREVDDLVDLYVDGMRCAAGRLLVAEDGSLQLAIEEVFGLKNGPLPADQQETVMDSPTQQMEV